MLSVAPAHDVFHANRHNTKKENIMTTQINWFEIPVTNLPRATGFYEAVLATRLQSACMDESPLAIFHNPDQQSCGCLIETSSFKPSVDGVLVYLNAGASIQAAIDRVAAAGGKVLLDKLELPRQLGYIAHVIDTEGNRVALHAMQ